ncbi:hypothetical protein [Streptomyces nogalater]|uniref:Uncharacterized protein n=1 Tax=Streptomyces nogalater TaxID=38314 RepID=A0ABW0WNU5_STRNO
MIVLRAAPDPPTLGRGRSRWSLITEQREELDVMHLRIYEVDVPIHDSTNLDQHGCD